jgi:methylmalonyl-CoA/ethylmalonyl-CoA epimerase
MKLDHIGIAVPDLAQALEFWGGALGLTVTHSEEVPEQGVRAAFLPAGGTTIELLEPLRPGEGPIARHLEKRGPGIHHICLAVNELTETLERLDAAGVQLIDRTPRAGAHGMNVAFIHPRATGGVLVELAEPGDRYDQD